jgi:hypothetical protein
MLLVSPSSLLSTCPSPCFSCNSFITTDTWRDIRALRDFFPYLTGIGEFPTFYSLFTVNHTGNFRPQWPYSTKYIYKEYHSLCPLVGIGTLPSPPSPASVPLPPDPKGDGTLACGWGVGGVPILTIGEKALHSAYSVPYRNWGRAANAAAPPYPLSAHLFKLAAL